MKPDAIARILALTELESEEQLRELLAEFPELYPRPPIPELPEEFLQGKKCADPAYYGPPPSYVHKRGRKKMKRQNKRRS